MDKFGTTDDKESNRSRRAGGILDVWLLQLPQYAVGGSLFVVFRVVGTLSVLYAVSGNLISYDGVLYPPRELVRRHTRSNVCIELRSLPAFCIDRSN